MVPEPPLVTRSRPWSKNCPKKVIQALNGADSPASAAVFSNRYTSWSSPVPNWPSRPGLATMRTPSLSTSSLPSTPKLSTPSAPGSYAVA
ncbi:hypothetical protein D3C81_925310 [compost metagenome]